MYNVDDIRADFPVFSKKQETKPFVYLDTAASAQKPQCVIDKICEIYQTTYANVHRGLYDMAERVTSCYEEARIVIQNFIHAKSASEIVFTRNATESINLVASSWALNNLSLNDEILISEAEHHANLVCWQIVAQKTGAKLKIFKINDDGTYNKEEFEKCLNPKVKLVAVTAMSNVLGTVFPVKEIIRAAHLVGAKVLIDACQSIVHQKADVQDLDCDFLAFSGHKLYGPTGIGVLYAKSDILNDMPPYQTGGDMVDKVTYQKTTYALAPARFEAGTPAFVQAIGLAQAIKYVLSLGFDDIQAHESSLISYFNEQASLLKGFKIIGTAPDKGSVMAFDFCSIHPQDLAFVLSHEGVAIRIGHHCAEPLVNRMGYSSICRASFGLYTTKSDIDAFFSALQKAKHFF
ncbi:MAG: SufS family cysteine desulfurase [Alphaproteobacteria bacterium]|nr:SufS family cysteine desulfurase [Alphaproteobacteria bacterium]